VLLIKALLMKMSLIKVSLIAEGITAGRNNCSLVRDCSRSVNVITL